MELEAKSALLFSTATAKMPSLDRYLPPSFDISAEMKSFNSEPLAGGSMDGRAGECAARTGDGSQAEHRWRILSGCADGVDALGHDKSGAIDVLAVNATGGIGVLAMDPYVVEVPGVRMESSRRASVVRVVDSPEQFPQFLVDTKP